MQGQRRQVGLQHLGSPLFRQRGVLIRTVQPQAIAGGQAAGAASPLSCGRLGNSPRGKACGTRGSGKQRLSLQTAVYHRGNTLNGQAGFGNVGRQHHLALSGNTGVNRCLLLGQGKAPV